MSLDAKASMSHWRPSDAGMFLVCVALPLLVSPFSQAPFADLKLVVLSVGALLIVLQKPVVDRALATAGGAFVTIVALGAVLGLDASWSLLGSESQNTGVVTLATSVVLACSATITAEDLRRQIPKWLFWTGVLVSAVSVLGRFVDIGGQTWRLGTLSSTLGHRVFVGGFVAAAIIAGSSLRVRSAELAGLLVLGSALAVTAVRSAWLGLAAGMLTVFVCDRARWKPLVVVLVPVVLAVSAWTAGDRLLPEKEIEFSAVPRFAQITEGSAEERIAAARAFTRAWRNDPVLGTGPATGWYDYLHYVTPDDIKIGGRGFGDAHNIALELITTTGLLGGATFVAFGAVLLRCVGRSTRHRRWALGAAVALVVIHLFQPLNVVLTPLLFLTAGLAAQTDTRRRTVHAGWLVAVVLVLAVVASTARLTASSLERYGRTYASEDAFRWSLRFEPWRIGAAEGLAKYQAFEHGAGDERAGREALALAEQTVRNHRWHAGVRLEAANVAALVDDEPRARRYLDDHVKIFPHDPLALAGIAVLALRAGDHGEAQRFARRALTLDPDLALAQSVLTQATAKSQSEG